MRFLPPVVLVALLIAAPFHCGIAADAKKPVMFSSDLNGVDLQFLISAREQGLVQSAMGDLAMSHAESSEVKTFSLTLAKEHAVQNEKIKLIAIKKGFMLPDNVDPAKNPAMVKLSKLQGLKFDKTYMEEMLQQQENYLALFQQAAQSHDLDIKGFAITTLPGIRQHLAFLRSTTGGAPRTETAPDTTAAPTPSSGKK